jgi:glycosyltransferase involved in cell wall biosynthesis
MKFQAPWKIPSILTASTCVIAAEHGYPVPGHTPHIAKEAMASGRCIIISHEMSYSYPFNKMENRKNIIVVNPNDTKQFSEVLRKIINDPDYAHEIGKEARKVSEKVERFRDGIRDTITLYKELISEKSIQI